jgi:hypothetical protein
MASLGEAINSRPAPGKTGIPRSARTNKVDKRNNKTGKAAKKRR